MTIDTNELRRLAQAATPGPWYVTGKLTRYVEARIDGGLIQEVAACGPTKADGGYGPQQEANARLIAAANPAAISELLDRLEEAEKERDGVAQQLVQSEIGKRGISEARDALRAEVEELHALIAAVKKRADAEFRLRVKKEEEYARLQVKIEQMERQEPVGKFIRHPSNGLWEQDGYGDNPDARPLYALPGAQGEEK